MSSLSRWEGHNDAVCVNPPNLVGKVLGKPNGVVRPKGVPRRRRTSVQKVSIGKLPSGGDSADVAGSVSQEPERAVRSGCDAARDSEVGELACRKFINH